MKIKKLFRNLFKKDTKDYLFTENDINDIKDIFLDVSDEFDLEFHKSYNILEFENKENVKIFISNLMIGDIDIKSISDCLKTSFSKRINEIGIEIESLKIEDKNYMKNLICILSKK